MTEPMRQRRGRAIAMTGAEVDEFLATERTCRVATARRDGRPHVAPLWFVWDGIPPSPVRSGCSPASTPAAASSCPTAVTRGSG